MKVYTISSRCLRSRKRKWKGAIFENMKTQYVTIINYRYESADSGGTIIRYANKITTFDQI